MPKIFSKTLRAKDTNGDWHDIPAIVSEESFEAAEEAKEAADRAEIKIKPYIDADTPLFSIGILTNAAGVEDRTRTDGVITDFIPVTPNETVYFVYDDSMSETAHSKRLAVFEYAENTTTTTSPVNNPMLRMEEVMCQNHYRYLPLTVGGETNFIRLRIMLGDPSAINQKVYMMRSTEYFRTVEKDAKIVPTVAAIKTDETLKAGDYVRTLGFVSAGDNGGALYKLVNSLEEGQTANNSTIIDLDGSGNASRHGHNIAYAIRVFTDEPVTLESLNTEAIVNASGGSFVTILGILYDNQIRKVSCKDLTLSSGVVMGYLKTITVLNESDEEVPVNIFWDFDFEFNKITLTGSGPALKLDGAKNRYIRGNYIVATQNRYGTGIAMYCTKDSTQRNDIHVRDVDVQNYGLYIHPACGHGIAGNRYEIGDMRSVRIGIQISIDGSVSENWDAENNKWRYSWEGEEHFWIGSIQASNANETGRAVAMWIQPMSNVPPQNNTFVAGDQSVTGTLTGLTFHNLSVEKSDRGIYMGCGEKQSAWDGASKSRAEAGIKSIRINNMRVRESWWTWQFLETHGFIRDLVVDTTSMIRLSPCIEQPSATVPNDNDVVPPPIEGVLNQWDMNIATSKTPAVIRAGIFPNSYSRHGNNGGRTDCIGYDLKALTRDYGDTEVVDGVTVSVPRKILYISQPVNKPMTLTGDVDYNDLIADFTDFTQEQLREYYYTELYMTKYFIVDDSVRGSSISLKLPFHYEESAQGIRFRMPKKVGDDVATLVVSFQNDAETTTIVNTDTSDDHLYELSVYYNVSYPTPAQPEPRDELWTETKVLRDLGAIS